MVTLSDIKLEHKEAMDTVNILSARLQEEGLSDNQRAELRVELNYWDNVQHYIMEKYKSKEKSK